MKFRTNLYRREKRVGRNPSTGAKTLVKPKIVAEVKMNEVSKNEE